MMTFRDVLEHEIQVRERNIRSGNQLFSEENFLLT